MCLAPKTKKALFIANEQGLIFIVGMRRLTSLILLGGLTMKIRPCAALGFLFSALLQTYGLQRSKNKNPVRLQRTGPDLHRRDEKIRTSDLQHPMLARYRATLHPEWDNKYRKVVFIK